jgi:UDP-N-acetylglucosamine:LPS N-acetylglucosamine transferase
MIWSLAMIKNILIISSEYTGNGHKSITEALCEKFAQYEGININVIDGFSLGGKALLQIGKAYGTITRNAKELWRLVWRISLAKPQLINEAVALIIRADLMNLLDRIKPDIILSLHPNFIGSVLNILERNNIKIPFVTLIADLVSISPQWVDSRVDYIISPTYEAKDKCMKFKFPKEKVQVLGFPVRSRFYDQQIDKLHNECCYSLDKPLNCLIMSGGDGVGNMSKIASVLVDNFNCTVNIVAGRNAAAKKKFETSLGKKYGNQVKVFGFINNIQDLMIASDIAFTRGSPNVMMEAISCNTPLVITGALPGQEEGNPDFAKKHNLGVVCKDLKNIQKTVSDLLSDNAQKLKQIKKSQRSFTNPNTAKNIVDFIITL